MPTFSLIIPVHNGLAHLPRCLAGVQRSRFRDWELIVVDDGSADGSGRVAEAMGARVVVNRGRSGPAFARNLGASQATGQYLFFTDADCELHEDTLGNAAAILQTHPHLDALIGSYDDSPAHPGFISQYKNLLHHFTHQTSREEAQTFWTGCGAIRRDKFMALGGFDAHRYPRPAIEDIELGYRLRAVGGTIHLAKQVQVKHWKQWTFLSLLHSDIFDRAIPWTALLREQKSLPSDLNLQWRDRISAAAVIFLILQISYSFLRLSRPTRPHPFPLFPLPLILLLLNRHFYQFLWRKRGPLFGVRAIPLHWFYYFYSSLAFGWATLRACKRLISVKT
ncbi:MAG: glycosyltransferase family 2 protein [Chloroflexi bacterium]|nr:glycosyltransferase family 2 protein [Chloroflexota bacterium]